MLDLKENKRINLVSNGLNIHIEVKDGQAGFVESECPDHICEKTGRLGKEGDTAVCLPAKAMLQIIN